MSICRLFVVFAIAMSIAITARAEPLLGGRLSGLSFGLAEDAVLLVLEDRCDSVRRTDIQPPNFPLAARSEIHLICSGYGHEELRIDTLALTLADDRLVLVMAEADSDDLQGLSDAKLHDWMQFTVSWEERLVIDGASGRAWIMSPEAAHPNLFQWANPYVSSSDRVAYETSADRPAVLQFGADLETLKPRFREHCAFAAIDSYDPWLLTKPQLQQQVDCFGFEYAGFPRKIEAVFGDGILQQAWILTGAGEEDRVRSALIEAYGEATYVDAQWEIFADGTVMLRKDKPEVLMLSDELAPLYRAEYIDGSE